MANDHLTAGTEPPTVVQTGTRDLVVNHLPLATGWDAGRRDVELKRPSAFCLVLEPGKSDWPLTIVVILGLSAAPILGMVFTLLPGFERNAPWGLRASCVVLAAAFAFLLLFFLLAAGSGRRRLRFDRASGLFTVSRRPFWLSWGR